uniref:Nuclear receptor domain-containing protein n=1 Tax=Steinernema glaseri TaxID=37863 RepID=A0A1I7ZRE3_9BILA
MAESYEEVRGTKGFLTLHSSPNCLVCGHQAKCCNYGVPSCVSCKSFFRRAVLSGAIPKCARTGNCNVTRGVDICRACRFKKCVELGMRPESKCQWTNADGTMDGGKDELCAHFCEFWHQQSIKRENGRGPIERIKNLLSENKAAVFDACALMRVMMSSVVERMQTKSPLARDGTLKNLVYIESRIQRLRYSSYFPYGQSKKITDFLHQPCALNNADRYKMNSFCNIFEHLTKYAKMQLKHRYSERYTHYIPCTHDLAMQIF